MKELKDQVREFWNDTPCGSWTSSQPRYSREYYEEIEAFRYDVEPIIFAFAQFTRFHGKSVLEIGVGAGTDFLQWVRAGALAHGVDLTEESIHHVRQRLEVYGLEAKELHVADAENLPFEDGTFDLVYSWGVIHHSPDTSRALAEAIRVVKPGGRCKIMVYNRHSLGTYYLWLKQALLKGRPWKSLAWCLANHQESQGTKAYTKAELRSMIAAHPVEDVRVFCRRDKVDTLEMSKKPLVRFGGKVISYLAGTESLGWLLMADFRKCRQL